MPQEDSGTRDNVNLKANAEHQPREPAAEDARSYTDLTGWPASAECCGYTKSCLLIFRQALQNCHNDTTRVTTEKPTNATTKPQ